MPLAFSAGRSRNTIEHAARPRKAGQFNQTAFSAGQSSNTDEYAAGPAKSRPVQSDRIFVSSVFQRLFKSDFISRWGVGTMVLTVMFAAARFWLRRGDSLGVATKR
jgi:hypothetical protein